jgi:hypothetical protein
VTGISLSVSDKSFFHVICVVGEPEPAKALAPFPTEGLKKDSSELKNITQTKSINTQKNSIENYSQTYDVLSLMKKNPPQIPGIYSHDFNLKNIKNNLINETYGEIYQGKVPNIFFGHFMSIKNRPAKKSCMTQRHKQKLLTIIYYSP